MKRSGILALLGCIQVALSDTEILNFSSELHSTDAANLIPSDWPVLSRQNNSRILTINPASGKYENCGSVIDPQGGREDYERNCVDQEQDLWVVLELDDWFPIGATDSELDLEEGMYTIRVSWPASTPVDMAVSLFPRVPRANLISDRATTTQFHPPIPPRAEGIMFDLDQHRADEQQTPKAHAAVTNRRMFARVRASTTRFVRSPNANGAVFPFQFTFLPLWLLPASSRLPSASNDSYIDEIRFHIILEPLIIGLLPESILPGAVLLVAVLLVTGIFGLPLVNAALSKLANRARKGKGKWTE